jgi:hypothetical protein
MILLVHGFTFAVGLAVLILLIVAITAIWERLRDARKLKKFEEKRRQVVKAPRDLTQAAEKSDKPTKRPPNRKISRSRRSAR